MHLLPTPETACERGAFLERLGDQIADLAGHIDAATRILRSRPPAKPVQQDTRRSHCSRCESLEAQGDRVLWCRACCGGIEGFHRIGIDPASPDWASWRECWTWRTMELVDAGLDIDQAEEQALREIPLPRPEDRVLGGPSRAHVSPEFHQQKAGEEALHPLTPF